LTQEAPIGLDMRMLCTPVCGTFWDLRNREQLPAGLDARLRWAIGAAIAGL